MHNLIVGALKEGRVDRNERLVTFSRHACRKCDGMLLRNTYVEQALRKRLAENIEAGAGWHGSGDADDFVVMLRFDDET